MFQIYPSIMDRILTLEEVAELLRVSERTVADWVSRGELPGGKIGTAWRFRASEIENWLTLKLAPRIKPDLVTYETLPPLIVPERMTVLQTDKKIPALNRMIDLFSGFPGITSRSELANAIFDREKIMSTGIGLSVAVPHCRLNGLKEVCLAVGVAPRPIRDYRSFDNTDVQILVMILAGRNQDTEYIRVLSLVSDFLRDEPIRSRLISSRTSEEITAVFQEEKTHA